MMKMAMWLVSLGWLLLACGDAVTEDEPSAVRGPRSAYHDTYEPAEELEDIDLDNPLWLAQTELAYTAATNPSFQLGARTGGTNARCDKVTTGQVCLVPDSKGWKYCIHLQSSGGFSPTRQSDIGAVMAGFDTLQGWGFDVAPDDPFTGLCQSSAFNIGFFNSSSNSCGSSGSVSNNVNNYSCNNFATSGDLTEGANVVGQYKKTPGCTVKLDTADIEAKGGNAAEDQRLFQHAVAHGVAKCIGLGERSTESNIATRVTMSKTQAQTGMSTGERCALESFSTAGGNTFTNMGSCSSD